MVDQVVLGYSLLMAVMSWSPFLASAAGPFFSFTMVKMCRTTEVRVIPAVLEVYDDEESQVVDVHEGDRDHVDHVADALHPNVFLFCACVTINLATFQNRKSLKRKSVGLFADVNEIVLGQVASVFPPVYGQGSHGTHFL